MSQRLNNPRFVALFIALILVAGLAALRSLPRLEDPHFANRHAIIIAPFPGASAERVEALIVEPMETAIRQMAEVKHIVANARAGVAAVVVQLDDSVRAEHTDQLWAELRDKIGQLSSELPAGAGQPRVDTERNYAFTWIAALRWKDPQHSDILRLGRYAKELASRLRSVPGTDLAKLRGAAEEEIQVKVDTVKAASVGLNVPDVAALLAAGDAKRAAGELSGGQLRQSIELEGGFDYLQRIRRVPLLSLAEGGSLQLEDIAEVYRGEAEPPGDMAIINGDRGVVLAVRMLPEVRGDIWTRDIRTAVAAFAAQLPEEIVVEELFVQQRYTEVRLRELLLNILLGFSLIFVILLFTLGWRGAVIVALSLPLTMLFSLAVMRFAELPIHQMSVTGLIVALGIMVDNAIVVADTVRRFRSNGHSAVAAASKALGHLWLPLLGSTLTTILTFMPLALMPGPAGEFMGAIAQAVIFSLVGSWGISLFLIAPIAGRWLSPGSGLSFPRWGQWFQHSLEWVLQRPRRVLALACVLPLAGFVLARQLPEQFFPPADRDMINLELYLPAASSIARTRRASEAVSDYLDRYPEIISLSWFVGRNAPPFYYNLRDNQDGASNYAQAMISVSDYHAANRLVAELQSTLDRAFPGYQIIVRRLEQGPPVSAPVELRLYGHSLTRLKQLGDQIRQLALDTEGVTQVRSALAESVPKVWLAMNEEASQRSGLGLTDLSRLLAATVDGVHSGSLLEGTELIPLRVSGAELKNASVDSLMSLPLALATGPRPLSSLASLDIRPTEAVITRRDARRVNTIDVHIKDGELPATVLSRLKARLDRAALVLPAGYELEVGGDSEARNEAVGKLFGSLGIILVLLVVTVLLAFNSFRLSALVFAVAGQAAGMGLLSLWFSGYPSGFTAIVGLMGLMGLAVNAAIVILTELRSSALAMAGDRAAITNTVQDCTRHIVSTTLTTVAGLVPLIVAGGGFWPPFAIVLAGGTLLTTMISLYFVPAGFLVLRSPHKPALLRSHGCAATSGKQPLKGDPLEGASLQR